MEDEETERKGFYTQVGVLAKEQDFVSIKPLQTLEAALQSTFC